MVSAVRLAAVAAAAAALAAVGHAAQLTVNVPPLGTCDPFTGWVTDLGGPAYKV
jgi:hypothetical protein